MKKLAMFVCLVTLIFAIGGSVSAITHDFDSIATGTYSEAAFSSFFGGVSFDNTGGNEFEVRSKPSSLQPDFFGNVILNSPYNTLGNSTIATLDNSTDFVSVTLGDMNGDSDNLFLNAYDSSGNLVGSDFYANPASSYAGHTLAVSSLSADIAWVEFYGKGANNNSVFWDNLTFNETPAVPEPSSILLLGAGLLGLVGFGRKKISKK